MNRMIITSTLLCCIFSTNAKHATSEAFDADKNRYFGEKPPGLTPKLFDPNIVSPDGTFESGTFTPDMKSFYFTRKNGKTQQRSFYVIHDDGSGWGEASETDIKWPEFSADGSLMYVGKQYRERTATGWSEPKSPGTFINLMAHGRSVSASGTYYYTVYPEADVGEVYVARLKDGKYQQPIKMSKAINTGKYIAHPYIAPDESYLIWDMRRADSFGQADMYISFKQADGTWSNALNMGDSINTPLQESAPQVTHDGKFLFFTRGQWQVNKAGKRNYVGKRFWVDAKVIDNLKAKR